MINTQQVDNFFKDLRNLELNDLDHRCFHIISSIDDMFWEDNFDTVNQILRQVDIGATTTDLLLCYLTITYHGKNYLDYRSILFNNIKDHLTTKYPPDEVTSMLSGLE